MLVVAAIFIGVILMARFMIIPQLALYNKAVTDLEVADETRTKRLLINNLMEEEQQRLALARSKYDKVKEFFAPSTEGGDIFAWLDREVKREGLDIINYQTDDGDEGKLHNTRLVKLVLKGPYESVLNLVSRLEDKQESFTLAEIRKLDCNFIDPDNNIVAAEVLIAFLLCNKNAGSN